LTPAQAEERRRAAARHFPQVRQRRRSLRAVARLVGASSRAVQQWYQAWMAGGLRALRAKPKPGRPAKLTAAQWLALGPVLRRGARAAGFATEEWTLRRMAPVIRRQFGVTYHYRYLERPLKAHGFTVQRPMPQARERDERVVQAWLRHDWPALKKKLGASGASLPAWTKRVTRFGPA
jgi:putative transposase